MEGFVMNAAILVGEIRYFAGKKIPTAYGWLPCDGRYLKIEDYSLLYSVIGDIYGEVKEGMFRLPDMRPEDSEGRKMSFIKVPEPFPIISFIGNHPGY